MEDSVIQPDPTFAVPADDERLGRAAAALRDHLYAVHVVDTIKDARELVAELLPTDREVFTASSETLRLSGIHADIEESGQFRSVRHRVAELGGDFTAQVKLGAAPDVVVGSVHAVTEDGYLVAASASGSQLSSYAAGALSAIWVVGAQKVVPDLETALRRVRTYSLPREDERLRQTRGRGSFIGKILIMEREALPDRGTVILVRESVGF
ncbi:LUD domain-containing protein [Kribbella sp. NPDC049584]|uniref:LUD domain-containing protein n=1 Tax=Kribbella sp. NPDC049584 TaxID=3154833 RepID=UPI0034337DF9